MFNITSKQASERARECVFVWVFVLAVVCKRRVEAKQSEMENRILVPCYLLRIRSLHWTQSKPHIIAKDCDRTIREKIVHTCIHTHLFVLVFHRKLCLLFTIKNIQYDSAETSSKTLDSSGRSKKENPLEKQGERGWVKIECKTETHCFSFQYIYFFGVHILLCE